MRTAPSAAIVQRWLVAELQVSMAMSVARAPSGTCRRRRSRICPAGPLPLALAIASTRNEPVARAAPEPSVTCTFTVYVAAGRRPAGDHSAAADGQAAAAVPVAENRSVQPDSPSVAADLIPDRSRQPNRVRLVSLPSRTLRGRPSVKLASRSGRLPPLP